MTAPSSLCNPPEAEVLEAVSPPHLLVVAGPNGSGKSVLTAQLRALGYLWQYPQKQYINADEIAEGLRARHIDDPDRAAFIEGRARRKRFRELGLSCSYETVLSHPSGLLDLKLFRDAGYHVTFVGVVTCDPEINVERVRGRLRTGGHHVPDELVRARYQRCLRHFPRAIEIAHVARIYDSSDRTRLRLVFHDGALTTSRSVPQYLQERVVEPLQARADARRQIARAWGPAATCFPQDENSGTYAGQVLAAFAPDLYLQDAQGSGLVTHDGAVLSDAPRSGTLVRISYMEGVGSVEQPAL